MIGDYLTYCVLATPTAAPRGVWMMEDAGTPIADSSGNGRTAAATGTLDYLQEGPVINGEQMRSVNFGGTTEYLSVAETVDDGVAQMTHMQWFRTSTGGKAMVGQYAGSTNAQSSWGIWMQTGGEIAFFLYSGAGAAIDNPQTATSGYNNNRWHCVIVWNDTSGDFHVRVDDTSQDDVTAAGLGITWKGACTTTLKLGTMSSGSDWWTGQLGPGAYWQATLTAAERTSLYTGVPLIPPGRTIDYSGFPRSSMVPA